MSEPFIQLTETECNNFMLQLTEFPYKMAPVIMAVHRFLSDKFKHAQQQDKESDELCKELAEHERETQQTLEEQS